MMLQVQQNQLLLLLCLKAPQNDPKNAYPKKIVTFKYIQVLHFFFSQNLKNCDSVRQCQDYKNEVS